MIENNAVTLAALGILATCVGGLIWVLKFVFSKLLVIMEKNAEMVKATQEMTEANTRATKSADRYLRDRNGRDNEKHLELLKATEAIPIKMQKIADAQAAALLRSIQDVKSQHIESQHVDHQNIDGNGS